MASYSSSGATSFDQRNREPDNRPAEGNILGVDLSGLKDFKVPQALQDFFANAKTAAGQVESFRSPFNSPSGFSLFQKDLGTASTQAGGLAPSIDRATRSIVGGGGLSSALSGALGDAQKLTTGSFGPGGGVGGVIPEAIGQVGDLRNRLQEIPSLVPDITPDDILPTEGALENFLKDNQPVRRTSCLTGMP